MKNDKHSIRSRNYVAYIDYCHRASAIVCDMKTIYSAMDGQGGPLWGEPLIVWHPHFRVCHALALWCLLFIPFTKEGITSVTRPLFLERLGARLYISTFRVSLTMEGNLTAIIMVCCGTRNGDSRKKPFRSSWFVSAPQITKQLLVHCHNNYN